MSFPVYATYRESGVEWVGAVPGHWELRRLSDSVSVINGFPFDAALFTTDQGMPLVRIRDLNSVVTETRFRGGVVEAAVVSNADVLIGMDGDFNVGRWRGEGDALLNQRMCCLRGPTDLVRILEYALTYPLKLINDITYATTVKHLSSGQIKRIRIAVPPPAEQSAIAAFLDHETGKIDALVAEQERLIALLKEKRQAVIFHAVTKGLDASAPMKESGVAWLGQVPAHWDVTRLGHRYEVQLGRMLNEERAQGDDLRPYLRVFDVQWGQINLEDLPLMDFPPDARDRYLLQAGDLLVNEGGSYVGRSAIWYGEIAECYYQKALHRVRPVDRERDTTAFLYYMMELATRLGVFVAGGNQTTIDHLTAEKLRAHRFAFPPAPEQDRIVRLLEDRLRELNTLTTEAHRAIALLRERRAALISAAVTGKIDVRGRITPHAEKAA